VPRTRADGKSAPQSWLAGAWKWGAGSLSAGAAAVSIISAVRDVTGAGQVRWIGVAPAADTAWAIGDTVQLATTVTDGRGGVIPRIAVGWTSTDTSVATVDSAGAVVARAPGSTTIVAGAGGRIAQSRILVRQRPSAIRLLGDTLLRIAEGGTARLLARVVDARGHPVPGQTISWRSSDSAIASVDSTARVSAALAGRAVLAASSGTVAAELPLEVYAVPASITLLAGDNQRATVGRRIPDPVRAQVVSRGGRPMSGVALLLRSDDDTDSLALAGDTSDARGIAQVAWTLGGRPGRHRLRLGIAGEGSIGITVAADADPVPENTRIATLDDSLSGVAGRPLSDSVRVRITDSLGAPMPDVAIAWDAPAGSIAGGNARTDSNGEASARWTMGPRAGAQRASVRVGGSVAAPRYTITAAALPGPAAQIARVGTTPLKGAAGQALASRITLRVTDAAGNPVAGTRVSLRPSGGSVDARTPETDSLGRVSTVWTLGNAAGVQHLVASVAGVDRSIEIPAEARPGPAAKAAFEGAATTARAGRPLPRPVVVAVTDSLGNPVAGTLVRFATRSGKVSPVRARTDQKGEVAVRWTLGAAAGTQQLDVTTGDRQARRLGELRIKSRP
jgi:hypothetical protein